MPYLNARKYSFGFSVIFRQTRKECNADDENDIHTLETAIKAAARALMVTYRYDSTTVSLRYNEFISKALVIMEK